jgi:hypothetical protein
MRQLPAERRPSTRTSDLHCAFRRDCTRISAHAVPLTIARSSFLGQRTVAAPNAAPHPGAKIGRPGSITARNNG